MRAPCVPPWCVALVLAAATFAYGQDVEYLIEGRDQTWGTYNGQLWVTKRSDGKYDVKREIHFIRHGEQALTGKGERDEDVLSARFTVPRGVVGGLRGSRRNRPIRLWVSFWEKDAEIVTESKQGQVFRSTGYGMRVDTHPKNTLPIDDRRPKLMSESHTWGTFEGVPFIKKGRDKHEVDINDVGQGNLGDCYFMAGLAAVVYSDPHRIRSMIRSESDGSYSVYVFRHNDQWEEIEFDANGMYIPTVKATRIKVDPTFPASSDGKKPEYAWFGDTKMVRGKKVHEQWPMILEKAWAQHRGSYAAIEGGWASTPMSFFSAKEVWDGNPREISDEDLLKKLKAADRQHQPVTFGVPNGHPDHALNVHDDHYYSFAGMRGNRVRLYNPWGEDHPRRPLTIKEVKKVFDGMHIGRF